MNWSQLRRAALMADRPSGELDAWDEVFLSIARGTYATDYSIGDTVSLDLGTEGAIDMQIVAFDADALSDGTGYAPITWVSKQLLKTNHIFNPRLSGMTEGTGMIGGWNKSSMRAYLHSDIKPLIPSKVAQKIKLVNKYSVSYGTDGTKYTNECTTDDLWIPSHREVANSSETQGPVYSIFTGGNADRVKKIVGETSASYWVLRTAHDNANVKYVYTSGGIQKYYPDSSVYYIALGFCT